MKNLTHVVPRPLGKDYYTLKTHLNEKNHSGANSLFFSQNFPHTPLHLLLLLTRSLNLHAQPNPRFPSTKPTISVNPTHLRALSLSVAPLLAL